jgi:hypothetical protein
MLPGVLQTLKLADKLGIEARDVPSMFRLQPGAPIQKGDVVAESKGFMGFFKASVESEYTGTVESVSEVTGNVLIREPSIPVDVRAYIQGQIAEVIPNEGAIVETRAAMVQGIFGVGGERTGTIRVAASSAETILEADHIHATDAGKILIGGAGLSLSAIKKAADLGVIGLVAGGIRDEDLIEFLGYDIGVAITGSENIPLTMVITEGFGFLHMAQRTFDLFRSLEGREASLNGATQIRAGVIRPEVVSPLALDAAKVERAADVFELKIGTPIRIIREPYFGELGVVTELPATLQIVDSGTEVRVLRAKLPNGDEVTVPRANVEIIAVS